MSVMQELTFDNQPPVYTPRPDFFNASLEYASRSASISRNDFEIINWSWEWHGRDEPQLDLAMQLTRNLIVAAAGNGTVKNLDTSNPPPLPSSYSRLSSASVLTVAALRPDGQLASFSSRGSGTVNIAAPGCAIPALSQSGEWQLADGTSMAAPLVSFTAALLQSLNMSSAMVTKNRILASATKKPELANDIAEGRVLNIADAVLVYDDIVYTEGKRLVGRLQGTLPVSLTLSGERPKTRRFYRLEQDHATPPRWTAEVDGVKTKQLARGEATWDVAAIDFLPLGSNTVESIPLEKISVIIPKAMREPRVDN